MQFNTASTSRTAAPISQIERITPRIANTWLLMNTSNRPLSEATVAKYAAAMERGEWKLNGEPIIFGSDGVLMSGQHRLHAVIRSNITIDSLVVRGVSRDVFDTLDTHRIRKAADALAISGYTNTNKLASAGRAYLRMHMTPTAAKSINNHQIATCVDENPELVSWLSKYSSGRRVLPSSVVGVTALIEQVHGYTVANEFFDKAVIGANITPTDPEYLLREKFLAKKNGVSYSSEVELALIIKAANARILGKNPKVLKVISGEAMPKLVPSVAAAA